jgi:hypothetical protein
MVWADVILTISREKKPSARAERREGGNLFIAGVIWVRVVMILATSGKPQQSPSLQPRGALDFISRR